MYYKRVKLGYQKLETRKNTWGMFTLHLSDNWDERELEEKACTGVGEGNQVSWISVYNGKVVKR